MQIVMPWKMEVKTADMKITVLSQYSFFFQVETRGATIFVLELARILGKEDCGVIIPHEADLLRLLTPIAKLYTAKQVNGINTHNILNY